MAQDTEEDKNNAVLMTSNREMVKHFRMFSVCKDRSNGRLLCCQSWCRPLAIRRVEGKARKIANKYVEGHYVPQTFHTKVATEINKKQLVISRLLSYNKNWITNNIPECKVYTGSYKKNSWMTVKAHCK